MSDAFPSGKFFRIVNEGTGLCLAAAHGGTTHGAQKAQDRWTGEEGYIPYSHTNDQVLTLRTSTGHRGEVWFFSEIKNTYGDEDWHLVNVNKDIRSTFTLHVGPLDGFSQPVGLGLIGWGVPGQTQWNSGGGMIWPGPHEDKVVTVLSDGHGNHRAVLAARGGANQQWRFDQVDLSGEAVPTRRKGIYETSPPGTDLSKWRDVL
ncbi:hypothetical protein [Streptosporangium minutum]|uniref:Ricin B lectin domain-containing protein n=1 Tax=Streptosporangium minutum TaxID=569862 RepID=A0A243RNS1_9ACTN|nr:hypothetical protein [Streptosporangium minutum]OUC96499.1 hypothetical protein CA984_14900 [Streptosporangium minutum]